MAQKITGQREWGIEKRGRYYFSIQKSVKGGDTTWGRDRAEQVIYTRLRLGHSGLAPDPALIGKKTSGLCVEKRKMLSMCLLSVVCIKEREVIFIKF